MKRMILLALPLAAACSSAPSITSYLTPYRIDVRQGNFVSQEMVAQLKAGQTKDQVRFILGTPLLADMFHADRWDYVYRFQPGRGEAQQRHIVVYFSDGKLSRIAGDVVASGPGDIQAKPQLIETGKSAAEPKDAK
jgi:outer membrane protein assembly factor BamE